MHFIRRVLTIIALASVAAALSGCVIRPLWWGGHDHHDHEHMDYRFAR